jgi:hypothetical protein
VFTKNYKVIQKNNLARIHDKNTDTPVTKSATGKKYLVFLISVPEK